MRRRVDIDSIIQGGSEEIFNLVCESGVEMKCTNIISLVHKGWHLKLPESSPIWTLVKIHLGEIDDIMIPDELSECHIRVKSKRVVDILLSSMKKSRLYIMCVKSLSVLEHFGLRCGGVMKYVRKMGENVQKTVDMLGGDAMVSLADYGSIHKNQQLLRYLKTLDIPPRLLIMATIGGCVESVDHLGEMLAGMNNRDVMCIFRLYLSIAHLTAENMECLHHILHREGCEMTIIDNGMTMCGEDITDALSKTNIEVLWCIMGARCITIEWSPTSRIYLAVHAYNHMVSGVDLGVEESAIRCVEYIKGGLRG